MLDCLGDGCSGGDGHYRVKRCCAVECRAPLRGAGLDRCGGRGVARGPPFRVIRGRGRVPTVPDVDVDTVAKDRPISSVDGLASWREGPTRDAIVAFVSRVCGG